MSPRATWNGLLCVVFVSACAHARQPSVNLGQLQDGAVTTMRIWSPPLLHIYYYDPQPDITADEVARLLPWIVGVRSLLCRAGVPLTDDDLAELGPLVRHLSTTKCLKR